jgi:hypothetical protein
VHAAAREGVEVDRQGGHERLSFAGLHLGDLAAMKHDAAHELHVEMAHVEHALAGLATDREGLGEEIVQRLLQIGLRGLERVLVARDLFFHLFEGLDDRSETLAELLGFRAQLVIRQPAHVRLELVDAGHDRPHRLHVPLVLRAEQHGQKFVDHVGGTLSNQRRSSSRRS